MFSAELGNICIEKKCSPGTDFVNFLIKYNLFFQYNFIIFYFFDGMNFFLICSTFFVVFFKFNDFVELFMIFQTL